MKARKLIMNSEEMRKTRMSLGITAVVLFVFLSAQTSYATVEDRSTFQQWTFTDDNYGHVAPNPGWDNEFGTPLLYVGDRAEFLPTPGVTNYWELLNDEMDIYIPNFQIPNPYKIMEVELYWREGPADIVPDLPKEPILITFPYGQILDRTDEPSPSWTVSTFTIRIEPNPSEEWLFIKGNISLHQVSVSTVCVPEPATIGLFIGGALLALKRRRCVK